MDWSGAARSNYVRFKDLDALKKALEPWGAIEIEANGAGLHCLLARTEDGGWPSGTQVEGTDDEGEAVEEELYFDFEEVVVPHLAEGQALVVMQSGHEGLRYVTGHASAYTWDGRSCHLDLNSIHALAAETFGIDPNTLTAATF